jgi:lipopolysaccharide biosynthesis protein
MKAKIFVIVYLYYPDTWNSLWKQLSHFPKKDVFFAIVICSSNPGKSTLTNKIRQQIENALILESPNKGKDIGAKLIGLIAAFQLSVEPDYILFLHDKKSPHTVIGDIWRKKLLKVIDKEQFHRILTLLEKNPSVGIICTASSILNEYNAESQQFNCTSNIILQKAIRDYSFTLNNYSFVAGTMFWARFEPYKFFFSQHSPLSIREKLENGNVLDHDNGSLTHTWERLLSWIVTNNKLKIQGI